MPNKQPVSGASLGYVPTTQGIRGRVQGESESQYREYVRRMQGDRARQLATQRGIDTSGMYWDGTQFKDADERHWYSDPGVIGPIAVGAGTLGLGLLGGAAAAPAAAGFDAAPNIASAAGAANAAGLGGGGIADALAGLGGAGVDTSIIEGSGVPAVTGGSGWLNDLLKKMKDYGPTALAGIGAGRSLLQGPPQAQKDLERILALAEGRINATQPLFESLNRMASAQMPTYSRGGQ